MEKKDKVAVSYVLYWQLILSMEEAIYGAWETKGMPSHFVSDSNL